VNGSWCNRGPDHRAEQLPPHSPPQKPCASCVWKPCLSRCLAVTVPSETTYQFSRGILSRREHASKTTAGCEALSPRRDKGRGEGTTCCGELGCQEMLAWAFGKAGPSSLLLRHHYLRRFGDGGITACSSDNPKKITDWEERKPCPVQPGPVLHLLLFNSEKNTPLLCPRCTPLGRGSLSPAPAASRQQRGLHT